MVDNRVFDENLYLESDLAKHLYNQYAKDLPIIDYHCHVQAQEIFENREFEDIGQMWLAGDHYKWRAMRTFGIEETYITGSASYEEKFCKFAEIVPYLIGNPLYIWCALELKRYFGIEEMLCAENAKRIYAQTKALIKSNHITPQWCMEKSNVELVCTTEDPIDELSYHRQLAGKTKTRILTAFRPDQAMFCEREGFASYLKKLEAASGISIASFADLIGALEKRLLFFKSMGTTVSDDGIPYFSYVAATEAEVEQIFSKALGNKDLAGLEIDAYRTAFLSEMGRLYHKHGFVMQLHVGTFLDANTSKVAAIGQSTGFDCTDDRSSVHSIGLLLDRLTKAGTLPKTILYPLDLAKIETFAVLAAGFCDSDAKAKVQLGAPWWFNDQVYGMEHQFESVSNLYPLSLGVGMLTDSRSFLSYPRHELYRRLLCRYLARLVERGEYFGGESYLREIIERLCITNVKEYFGF
nr:glucuronate isomerase [uncultured Sphaerochaeta sp.]